MSKIGLLATAAILTNTQAFAQTGQGLDLMGELRNFPITKKIVEDDFFGAEEVWGLETDLISVKTSNSESFSSSALVFGFHVKPSDSNLTYKNATAVSAYFNAIKTLEILENDLGYKLPEQLKIVVDRYVETPWAIEAHNLTFSEAGYIRDEGQIAFSPKSQNTDSLAKSIDIVAHEIAHAVVANTSNLDTSIGSKLINEAFADIIGVYVESKLYPDSWDWKIGEDSYLDKVSYHRGIDDLADPRLLRHTANIGDGEGIYFLGGIVTTSFYYLATGKDLLGNDLFEAANFDRLVRLYFDVVTQDLATKVKVRDLKKALLFRAKTQTPELEERISVAFQAVGM